MSAARGHQRLIAALGHDDPLDRAEQVLLVQLLLDLASVRRLYDQAAPDDYAYQAGLLDGLLDEHARRLDRIDTTEGTTS